MREHTLCLNGLPPSKMFVFKNFEKIFSTNANNNVIIFHAKFEKILRFFFFNPFGGRRCTTNVKIITRQGEAWLGT